MKKSEKLAEKYDRQRRAVARLTAAMDETGSKLLSARKQEQLKHRQIARGKKCLKVWPSRMSEAVLVKMGGFYYYTRDSNYKEPEYAHVQYDVVKGECLSRVSDSTTPTFISLYYAKRYSRIVRCFNRLMEQAQVFPGEHMPR